GREERLSEDELVVLLGRLTEAEKLKGSDEITTVSAVAEGAGASGDVVLEHLRQIRAEKAFSEERVADQVRVPTKLLAGLGIALLCLGASFLIIPALQERAASNAAPMPIRNKATSGRNGFVKLD